MERIDRERKMQRELQELNIAMGVLLQRAEKEKETLSENVVSNVKRTDSSLRGEVEKWSSE